MVKKSKQQSILQVIIMIIFYVYLYYLLIKGNGSSDYVIMLLIFLPRNLKIEEFLSKHPPEFEYKLNHFYYVLGLIHLNAYKSPKNKDKNGFVRINAEALKNHIRHGSKYLKYLVDNGIWERSNYSAEEGRSRGFRFKSPYNKDFEPIEIKHKPYKPRKKKQAEERDPLCRQLGTFFNSNLTIDSSAFDWITSHPDTYMKRGEETYFDKAAHTYTVMKIQNREFVYPHIDKTAGRCHSTVTGMKKELRNFLSYKGERLCEIDLTASQLFLSLRLFDPQFYSMEKTDLITLGHLMPSIQKHYNNYTHTIPPIPIYSSTPPPPPPPWDPSIMFRNSSVSLMGCQKSDYVSHVTGGTFYDDFKNAICTLGWGEGLSKGQLKSIVFTVAYSKPDSIKYIQDESVIKPYIAFQNCYPDVVALFSALKRNREKEVPDAYKYLARLLQNIEAVLFLDRIVPRFMKENKGIPIYTIHDCVMVPCSYQDKIEKILVEETLKAIGYKPKYTVSVLSPENLNFVSTVS